MMHLLEAVVIRITPGMQISSTIALQHFKYFYTRAYLGMVPQKLIIPSIHKMKRSGRSTIIRFPV